jgi:hypothetical protein
MGFVIVPDLKIDILIRPGDCITRRYGFSSYKKSR